MKIIIDAKIPYIKDAIKQITEDVVYLPGNAFTAAAVKDADALIVRTRTTCDAALLQNSRVKFIATATIGYDHIDQQYLQKAGITWKNAPGCNAASVAQYIGSSLLLLERDKKMVLQNLTIGIVGVGHVGKEVKKMAERLGLHILCCDPPRAAQEGPDGFVSLATIAEQCDIITFHTPLSRLGKYATYHVADSAFFASTIHHPIIINTSRGEVIDTTALLTALKSHQVADAIMDVWEEEPSINTQLLQQVFLGTPHIAGYSADGKANATKQALDALCTFFHLDYPFHIEPPAPAKKLLVATSWKEAFLQMYNPLEDSNRLKESPDKFEFFRGNYPLRREEKAYTIQYQTTL